MADIKVTIDGLEVSVPEGTTILKAAEKAGIKIPTLCHHNDLCASGSCRICVVEVEGARTLQASCCYPISSPLIVKTNTAKVRNARSNILQLMLSEHYGDCYTCKRNLNCELQTLAANYGVDSFKFGRSPKIEEKSETPVFGDSDAAIQFEKEKCILCERCVRTCIQLQDIGALGKCGRSNETHITTFGDNPLNEVNCINCGQCVNRCPTGALTERDDTDAVWRAIEDPTKHVVIQTAPAPRAGIGECFGLEPGVALTFQMNTAIRQLGFDRVFDTNFTADLTIIEEGVELIIRLYKALVEKDPSAKVPQFTSCSPGWIKYIEHFYPNMLDHLSSAKSPQQMFGAVIKTYYAKKFNIDPANIVSVALMPCTAKKFECDRPEMRSSGFKDVDYGLTTREMAKMIKEAGMDLPKLAKSDFDDPFGSATGSGVIFAATGGVMEAAIRTVYELVTGKKIEGLFSEANIVPVRGFEGIKYAELPITEVGPVPELIAHLVPNWDWLKGATLKVAIAHGTANAKKILDDIQAGGKFSECHFIEFMACPGGCLGGGGQPIPTTPEIRKQRAKAIYGEDMEYVVRKSHENPAVLNIYKEFLTDGPCGHKSHDLLHTSYTARGKYIK
ncbi:MAG: [FeFe] hydrogenase, group A [Gammaproteobacteria bacterium]|nr:[FeFe] hydrogenase, group A [Gammaproteobacteria bacterium]